MWLYWFLYIRLMLITIWYLCICVYRLLALPGIGKTSHFETSMLGCCVLRWHCGCWCSEQSHGRVNRPRRIGVMVWILCGWISSVWNNECYGVCRCAIHPVAVPVIQVSRSIVWKVNMFSADVLIVRHRALWVKLTRWIEMKNSVPAGLLVALAYSQSSEGVEHDMVWVPCFSGRIPSCPFLGRLLYQCWPRILILVVLRRNFMKMVNFVPAGFWIPVTDVGRFL